ncbi:hypothetical protein A3C21_02110 [Candidatus Kaiserbacteria bacterium RIFCSPHIGHO2_02_FULL_59_21]|uniref:riboflavin kinase n=1 Tax=Candidatus Kaiserbacteria bacterium RIFCSPHIGHO2_02_FULL_59_21 TaxID=1798500 RepID=A0A1F6E010_9BACT|nr:MAG: hypothetical protein A2766_03785 [Candidatus Kaiserbacteria bacterium RIFCSPHIGHO2_01_FULL_58_22]OGG67034.1 MAG: hypothetical protein A3C21_02110 [Candidatus Kaiserbacteria bacterium RIFCSPHIGHO2_02_FULL_59_21]OGG80311.1 MAG: hypothetical protein A2952_02020 [Candidatus Kaiserbacteria bacterium RIFCSPLOWO2_01_FULL_59_34]OGG85783.1 MAG: hypothetical protein A3I47_00670 [Candidatus Kaiserbacteria bacterium RIFCSPLOWO2_02_FULL_59_19]
MKSFSGVVQKGTKRAASLGYPTVNIPLDDASVSGIYAARVAVGDARYLAAAFADPTRRVLEAHIIDASPDLYGKEITIELIENLRDSATFESDDTLRAAIADDVQKVREYFKSGTLRSIP